MARNYSSIFDANLIIFKRHCMSVYHLYRLECLTNTSYCINVQLIETTVATL